MFTLGTSFGQALPRVPYRVHGHGLTTNSSYGRVPRGGFHEWTSFAQEVTMFAEQTLQQGDSAPIFHPVGRELGFVSNEECLCHNVYAHWTKIVEVMGQEISLRNPGTQHVALGEVGSCMLLNPAMPDFIIICETQLHPPSVGLYVGPIEVKQEHVVADDTTAASIVADCNELGDTNLRLAFTQLCGQIMGNGETLVPNRAHLRFGLGYGMLTSFNSCWFTKVVHEHGTSLERMYISNAVGCTQVVHGMGFYKALWFILNRMVLDRTPNIPAPPCNSRRRAREESDAVGGDGGSFSGSGGAGPSTQLARRSVSPDTRRMTSATSLRFHPETYRQMTARLNEYADSVCAHRGVLLSELDPYYSGVPVDEIVQLGGPYLRHPHKRGVNVARGFVHGVPAVIKFGDLTKCPDALEAGLWETYMYKVLRSLQGRCIPTMATAGFAMCGMCFMWAIIDDGGVSLAEDPRKVTRANLEQALVCLGRLHDEGVLHGDLHRGNIIALPNGSMQIIDFVKSRLGRGTRQQQRERKILEDMIAATAS